jgi:hypothetical protein
MFHLGNLRNVTRRESKDLFVLLEKRYNQHIHKFYKKFSLCVLAFMGILHIYNQMMGHRVKSFSGQHMLFVLFSLIDCHFNQDIFHLWP